MTRHVLVVLTLLAASSAASAAMTAEELVAKNLEARGGAAKLHALTSMHTVGTRRVGGGSDAKTESWAVAPGKYRSEFTLQGLVAIQACDGPEAWSINPFRGRREPQKLSPDDAKDLVQAADVAGPFSDYKAKGSKIEALGTEDIDGTEAYKLRVTFKNGDTQYVFLDPDSFLEIRTIDHRMVRGQENVSTTDLGEYEKVDGIYVPFEIGRNHLDKVELNVTVDPKMFSFPAPAPH
jgi:outer membrane lipoprotein-sorting protein